jgi:hypothetical protein
MRFTSPGSVLKMRAASQGPAARAESIRRVNQGLPQIPFVSSETMRRGGSMGMQSQSANALGCLCGPGDPGFLGDITPPLVIIGPIAARMIQMRAAGASPQAALLDAYARLQRQGVKIITPEIHMQIAAGMQPMSLGTTNLRGLGSLGLAPALQTGLTTGTVAASSVGTGVASALGIGSALAVGQTAIPIPVVGAVIGAAIYEAVHLLQRHVGKAEAAWNSPAFLNSLKSTNGRDYDEHSFSEAFKGMLDTGNNIVPGCGPDRHKDPDCLLGPMANVIAQGYLSRAVPLSATTSDVYRIAVQPWLASGAGKLVNWANLAKEPTQQLMMQAAADRYLAGQAMTRGDMASYGNQGAHTVPLVQALQPILQQMAPTTNTPTPAPVVTQPTSNYVQPISTAPQLPDNTGTAPSIISTGVLAPPLASTGGGSTTTYQASPIIAAPPVASAPAMNTASIGGGLPTWLTLGIAVLGLGMVFFRAEPVKNSPKV